METLRRKSLWRRAFTHEVVNMRLKDKVTVVTGAGRGIGLGIALAFARKGARVALCDIDTLLLGNALVEIDAAGGQGLAFQMDVTSKEQIHRVVHDVLDQWGAIDILVN
ncbi:MAG: SDR family NAD(P)-dependent oxidoreductase, partial [Anaerolineales bacterium]|nr:SDR family NAD(P)-dependent oxidoreductase [Anaerolineales bacterium]